ncbi:MAG: hypothetical protein JXL80_14175 [Planctomycetes bacterium]|nr:hypothetical protein [Planctomycetota bacterium]
MKRLVVCLTLTVAMVLGTADVQAQVRSHVLPDELPTTILPPAATEMPKYNSTELSVPLLAEDRPRGTGSSSGAGTADAPAVKDDALSLLEGGGGVSTSSGGGVGDLGNVNASTLEEMSGSPRKVVEMVNKGQHAEAATLGKKIMDLEEGVFNDFVWDYVAEATAMACARVGDFAAAADAHRAAQKRVRDTAVQNYHEKAAVLMGRGQPKDDSDTAAKEMAAKLTNAEAWRQLILDQLATELRNAKRGIEQMKSARTAEARVNSIKVTWANLRYVYAGDPKTGQELLVEFKAAADSLMIDTASDLLDTARKQHQNVVNWQHIPLKPSQIPRWNEQVKKLWNAIEEVKRICRVHDYLARLKLAGAGAGKVTFDAAHDLLYEPGGRSHIYKLMGQKTAMGLDMKRTEPAP